MASMDIFEGDAFDHRAHPGSENIPFKPATLSGSASSATAACVPHRQIESRGRHPVADPVLRARLGLRPAGLRAARRPRLRLPPVQEAGRDLGLRDPERP